jgi:hypothetical protein
VRKIYRAAIQKRGAPHQVTDSTQLWRKFRGSGQTLSERTRAIVCRRHKRLRLTLAVRERPASNGSLGMILLRFAADRMRGWIAGS